MKASPVRTMIGSGRSTHPPPGPDAFQVEGRDDPVVSEPEREVRVVVEWGHPTFFLNRISASLSRLGIALMVASRRKAELRLGCASCQTSLVGRRLRV
jgi:hypothetical protein